MEGGGGKRKIWCRVIGAGWWLGRKIKIQSISNVCSSSGKGEWDKTTVHPLVNPKGDVLDAPLSVLSNDHVPGK